MAKRTTIGGDEIMELIQKKILSSREFPEGTNIEIKEITINMFGPILTEDESGMIVFNGDDVQDRITTFTVSVKYDDSGAS